MAERIGPAPQEGIYPLWAWHSCGGNRKKPDLRSENHFPKGKKGVRIEFEIHDKDVLLSCYHDWHFILNKFYLPSSDEDYENYTTQMEEAGINVYRNWDKIPIQVQSKIEKSWLRIFDINSPGYSSPDTGRYVQATFWELRFDQVTDVKNFTGR